MRKSRATKLLYGDLTYKIRGSLFSVWKELGPAFKESAYQKAVAIQFDRDGIQYVREPRVPIFYKEEQIGVYRPDFIIANEVVVELKALPRLTQLETRQLWYYLKGSPYRIALLVNFGSRKLDIRRWIYDAARPR